MNIVIRHEQANEYKKVEEVARNAFWNLYTPGCSEHLVINQIRKHKDFIKELSFVIEVDGEIVGSIFYTHSKIIDKNGTTYKTISFGPVCIEPKYHRTGLGRKLITHSINKAKELGYNAILTLGYDYHYSPYGFKGGKLYNISMPDGKFYKGLLVLPLFPNSLSNISGYAVFSDGLEPNMEQLEKFDSNFPFKEKKVMPSQEEFKIASVMIDE